MKFVNYHIGARDGTREFPLVQAFAADVFSVMFDGDATSIAGIKDAVGESSNMEVHSFVVAREDGSELFFHTSSPYATSLLPPCQESAEWSLFWVDHDYVIKEALRVVRTEEVKARSLDSLLAGELANSPSPNFLSLDTQGSELDILRGARRALSSSIVGCVAEVEFHRLYDNQPLFGDVSAYLTENGFWFVGFQEMLDLVPYRAPVGLRGRGFHFTCNALFLKRPEVIAAQDARLLPHLAFCSAVYGRFEVTWRCFDLPQYDSVAVLSEGGQISQFLSELRLVYLRHPRNMPPSFDERAMNPDPCEMRRSEPTTEFELLLERWGLDAHVEIVRTQRLAQQKFARKAQGR